MHPWYILILKNLGKKKYALAHDAVRTYVRCYDLPWKKFDSCFLSYRSIVSINLDLTLMTGRYFIFYFPVSFFVNCGPPEWCSRPPTNKHGRNEPFSKKNILKSFFQKIHNMNDIFIKFTSSSYASYAYVYNTRTHRDSIKSYSSRYSTQNLN